MPITRRQVRIKVMNVLYAYEISKDPIEKVKTDLLTDFDDDEKFNFACNLITKFIENQKHLDEIVEAKVAHWEYERIAMLDKIIMKMAIAEILYFPEIPPKVSINEAIEIAKEYCTRSSGGFVNGILDSVFIELKNSGKLEKKGRGLLELKKKSNDK